MQGMGKALTDSMMRSLTYTLNAAKTPLRKNRRGLLYTVPSKMIMSPRQRARASSSAVRTVQAAMGVR